LKRKFHVLMEVHLLKQWFQQLKLGVAGMRKCVKCVCDVFIHR
jgi:hypothetical protein